MNAIRYDSNHQKAQYFDGLVWVSDSSNSKIISNFYGKILIHLLSVLTYRNSSLFLIFSILAVAYDQDIGNRMFRKKTKMISFNQRKVRQSKETKKPNRYVGLFIRYNVSSENSRKN